MLRIGYDLPKGWLAGGMMAWRVAGKELSLMPLWTVWALKDELERRKNLFVLDVRQPREWASGHLEGACHITGAAITERLAEIPHDRPVAVICGSGYRSSAVASMLKNKGYSEISSVIGGMGAWKQAGFKTVR
jgi:hydroxyacylglutathione hydrolase